MFRLNIEHHYYYDYLYKDLFTIIIRQTSEQHRKKKKTNKGDNQLKKKCHYACIPMEVSVGMWMQSEKINSTYS